MKKTISALALTLIATSAIASDIPSRIAPIAPVAPVAAFVSDPRGWVGVNGGFSVHDGFNRESPWTFGIVGGYNVTRLAVVNLGVEATYDYKKGNTHTAIGNVITSIPVGSFTPYVLAGVGYRWDNSGMRAINEGVWSVGAGVKYAITRNVELDARYRHIEDFNLARPDDRVTLGVNFKF